jgi:hypothetical protein
VFFTHTTLFCVQVTCIQACLTEYRETAQVIASEQPQQNNTTNNQSLSTAAQQQAAQQQEQIEGQVEGDAGQRVIVVCSKS